ncbi:uncharacterized protein DUF1996 [Nonomuraea polychroma]|uniref:Uncharacterized protein DUF1996 n=1 Tax=Nonomuraea polychroma TaxID=46176 RepID=A0A438MN34_9ACTN|nr:uncharacterized protein DUF1996 [Nonomuraea polychroma]
MRIPSGGRRFRPWLGALCGSIALALSATPAFAHAGTVAAQTIVCPGVADKLPDIPAAAQAEVDRNLALLDKQLQEANDRLARSVGQGGPNFVQNAILGPLASKRGATIDRIAIAIGRTAERPTGLDNLATCTLSDTTAPAPPGDGATSTPAPTTTTAPDPGTGQSIVCPSVADKLPPIPAAAQGEVDRNLALLEKQIQEANNRLATSIGQGGPNFVRNAILGPLASKRGATIDRIAIAIGRTAQRPTGLDNLATCTLSNEGGAELSAADFVDIQQVPASEQPEPSETGSTGTFLSRCGTSSEDRSNNDNLITAPGVSNGAQALYEYVGNMSADALSTNESLADADTTCRNQADQSAYFWPTLRVLGADAAETDGDNAGTAVQPSSVRLEYRGNPTSEVTTPPQFLRMLAGDARAATNGGAEARPTWTCTGFTDRLTDKYPICPSGSDLVRVFDMPSCWDGENIDSADHRTNLAFPDEDGACPSGTEAVPQLRLTLTYDDVPNTEPEGTNVPFAVDSLASEANSPNTDHAGAIVVMSEQLVNKVVQCINSDKEC